MKAAEGVGNIVVALTLCGFLPAAIAWSVLRFLPSERRWFRGVIAGAVGALSAFGITYGAVTWDVARVAARGEEVCGAGAAAMLLIVVSATLFHFVFGLFITPILPRRRAPLSPD